MKRTAALALLMASALTVSAETPQDVIAANARIYQTVREAWGRCPNARLAQRGLEGLREIYDRGPERAVFDAAAARERARWDAARASDVAALCAEALAAYGPSAAPGFRWLKLER